MNRRLLTSVLVALVAASALSACFPLPTANHASKPSVEATDEASEEPTDDSADEPAVGGYTADQVTMLDAMFVATTGQSFEDTRALVGEDLADQAADQYLTAADALCGLDPTLRESQSTHDGFVGGAGESVSAETAEAMWNAMITYCATQD